MKQFMILAIAAVLVTGTATAQHSSQPSSIGLKAGVNFYNINTDASALETDYRTGFHAGLIGHIHIGESWAFQPEVMFSGQGARFSNVVSDPNLKLGYINVPLIFQYLFDNGFRIQAGPQVGFLISAEADNGDNEIDVKDEYQSIDVGIGAGLSYVHPPSGFGVDLRYNWGLTNINENDAVNSTNHGLQFGVFYLFRR